MKLPFGKAPPPSAAAFIILACLALTCFAIYTEFQLQCFVTNCRANSTAPSNFAESVTTTTPAPPKPEFRLLLGILTKADFYERRHLVRHAYALQPKVSTAQIDVRFVLCRLTTEEQKVMVAMEIMLYDDIIILNCTENMDDGKTYTYFSSLPQIFNDTPYDFVTKTDDDTYFRLEHLAGALRQVPREDVYLGFLTPCGVPQAPFHFMSGMGYTLSWDVVQWIGTDEGVRRRPAGPEDVLTSIWLTEGKRGKNRFDMNLRMYDYMEEPALCFRHPFIPDTIAVHKLKTNLKWARTLSYFNVTQGLKPSKRYHI